MTTSQYSTAKEKNYDDTRTRQGSKFHFGSEAIENSKDRHSSCEEASKGRMLHYVTQRKDQNCTKTQHKESQILIN